MILSIENEKGSALSGLDRQAADLDFLNFGIASWLRRRAVSEPTAIALRYLKKNNTEIIELSFEALDREARRLGAWLLNNGRVGDRVLLTHGPGHEFVAAFFACQYAGFIAVPAFPPRRTRHGNRVTAILQDADCRLALGDALGRAAMHQARRDETAWANVLWPEPGDLTLRPMDPANLHRPGPDAIAFLQYTSGSTGDPKGVMVTHANLKHNLGLQKSACNFKPGDVMVSWAPFFHDMGLVYGLLLPIEAGGTGVYCPANDFVQTPGIWLKALSDHGATHTSAPNFAFDHCLRHLQASDQGHFDLSNLRYCVNGSEPVRAKTIRDFESALNIHGLRRGVVQPAYGMAESTLFIAAGFEGDELSLCREDRAEGAPRELVACGTAIGQTVVIVDPLSGRPCPMGRVGEIWVQSPSVTMGYWHRPQETEAAFGGRLPGFDGSFLKTGDLGFMDGQRVVVSGRLKDLVILRGVNHYPQDLERTARAVSGELGQCAAFSVDELGGERLVLVQETARHPKTPLADLAAALKQAIVQEHGVQVDELVLVGPNAIPKTSSGKIQRRACRLAYLEGTLKLVSKKEGPRGFSPVLSPQERLAWIRSCALSLGGIEPSMGLDAPLDAWCLDSLKIAELAGRYKKEFQLDLDVFSGLSGSLRALMDRVAAAPAPAAPPEVLEAPPTTEMRRWPCHRALESIWAFQQTAPDSNAYHIAWTAHLSGRPDVALLERALQTMSRSQSALHSAFEIGDASTLWQVEQQVEVVLEQPWREPGRLDGARNWAQAWNQVAFDSAQAPLWKAAYLPLDDGGCLLAFAFHHIIFDQRSIEIFLESLDALVLNPNQGLEVHAAIPPARIEDAFSLDRARAYWTGHLQGLKEESWLDRSLFKMQKAPKVLKAVIPAETVGALRRLAAGARCTPFSIAALAWTDALAGLGNGDDACFTVPFTLRDQPLSDRQIGYWVHPLPLRLRSRTGQDLPERLTEAAKVLREAMDHRQLSLAEAMRCVGLPAPAAFLSYQGETHVPNVWLGSKADLQALPFSGCKAALLLEVSGETTWALNLEYHPLAVSDAVAQRCLQAFQNYCGNFSGRTKSQGLSYLRSQRLVPREHRTVVEAFDAHVLLDAKAIALVDDRGSMDYGTLAGRVRSLASTLTQAGVVKGDRVGVSSAASMAWVTAMLACFEMGAVYVPLDPAYPHERLKVMVEDSRCRVILSDCAKPLWAGSSPWMDLDTAQSSTRPFLRVPGQPRPEDPAYVIFTSGSSGRPKGVQVSHAALMNNAQGIVSRLKIDSLDRVMQFSSISFDPSLQDVFPTLLAGARVVLPLRKGAPGPAELSAFITKHAVSLFFLPTAYWHAFMQAGGANHLKNSPSLRCVMAGGEAPAPRLVREWIRVLPKVPFINAYGPTETCIIVTLHECTDQEDPDALVPLGDPLPGVELAVVGKDGKLLPAGESGELWIGGDSLADGYLSPQGLERSQFSPSAPDNREPRAFYRTGDLAVMDPQGRIVYRGRIDRQIKAAGIRMDLEEIEAVLARAEGVSAAVVDAEGGGDDLKLRAWVAADLGCLPNEKALQDWLKKHVNPAFVPHQISVLSAFPVGPSGKIDRKALKAMPYGSETVEPICIEVKNAGPSSAGVLRPTIDFVAPLCAVFTEILGRPAAADDDFFALGGTSLRAVRLAGEASRRLERNVLVDQIYQAPTPRGLATLLGGGPSAAIGEGVLRLFSQGPGPDCVLLPPVSGRLGCYRAMAALLEGRCRVWGLDVGQLPAPDDGGWNAWVESCVAALETALPDSELVLGGWSMGGLLATDMARLLTRRGRKVRRLFLIDAVLPDPLDSALILNDQGVLAELIIRDLEGGSHVNESGGGSTPEERQRYRRHVAASTGFTLKPLSMPVSLVLSERTSREDSRTSWMAWSLMATAGMTCQLVAGDHFSVLSERNIKRIAEHFMTEIGVPKTGSLVLS